MIRYCICLHLLGNFFHQFLVAFLRLAIALQSALHPMAFSHQERIVTDGFILNNLVCQARICGFVHFPTSCYFS